MFKDEQVAAYYDNVVHRPIKKFFLQRVADSSTYILVFPTGLLLLVGISSLQIQAKLQLGFKKDESIIDFCYCVSENFRNQCIWMLDEKLQVWKCSNELNPSSCNWTLVKQYSYDNLFYKKFLTPAMTYDDFYMSTTLNRMRCYKNLGLENGANHKYVQTFNAMSTKTILAKQPKISSGEFVEENIPNNLSIEESLKKRLGLTGEQLRSYKV